MAEQQARFPREKASRRAGWTEGPGLVLADGNTWHLPAIDEGLIPYLKTIVPLAEQFERSVMHLRSVDDPESDATYDISLVEIRGLALLFLAVNYRNRRSTLERVLGWSGSRDGRFDEIDALYDYIDKFARFVTRRVPAYFESADLLPMLN